MKIKRLLAIALTMIALDTIITPPKMFAGVEIFISICNAPVCWPPPPPPPPAKK